MSWEDAKEGRCAFRGASERGQHRGVPALVFQIAYYCPEECYRAPDSLRVLQLQAMRSSGKRLYSAAGQREKRKAKQGIWEA